MQVKLSEQISSADAENILKCLPDWIQDALIARPGLQSAKLNASVSRKLAIAISRIASTG